MTGTCSVRCWDAPLSTAVQVAALFAPGYLIEAEAWALVDD